MSKTITREERKDYRLLAGLAFSFAILAGSIGFFLAGWPTMVFPLLIAGVALIGGTVVLIASFRPLKVD